MTSLIFCPMKKKQGRSLMTRLFGNTNIVAITYRRTGQIFRCIVRCLHQARCLPNVFSPGLLGSHERQRPPWMILNHQIAVQASGNPFAGARPAGPMC
jgi:hypothetical protein